MLVLCCSVPTTPQRGKPPSGNNPGFQPLTTHSSATVFQPEALARDLALAAKPRPKASKEVLLNVCCFIYIRCSVVIGRKVIQIILLYPKDPITFSDDDWVYNHLLSKVFRFHDHSQKVIGSLGIGYIWRFRFYKSVSDQRGIVIGVIGDENFVPQTSKKMFFFSTQKMDRNGGGVQDSFKNMSNLQVSLDVLATCVFYCALDVFGVVQVWWK